MIIIMPIFILLFLFLISCETPTTSSVVWYKYNATQDDLSKDHYTCLLNSQQRVSNVENDTSIEIDNKTYHFAGHAKNQVVTNRTLYNACMNAHGWYLREVTN